MSSARRLTSLSGLQLVAACPGSASLPHRRWVTDRAALGSALHEVQETRIAGNEPDLEAIAAQWELAPAEREDFGLLSATFRPDVPPGALAEVALGLFEDGHVERVVGARGEYEARPGLLVAGTLDVLWSEPEPLWSEDGALRPTCAPGSALWVVDWKLSDYSPPIGRNWQLRVGALLAARWTGARRVIPAVCVMSPGPGEWDVPAAPLEQADFLTIETELRELLARRDKSTPAVVRCEDLITGPHCEHCDARWCCPAQVSEARALVAHHDPAPGPLTTDQAARLAALLPSARAALKAAEDAVKAHVRALGPIALEGGKVFDVTTDEIDVLEPSATFLALAAEIGEGPARAAFGISKQGIYDAIGAAGLSPMKPVFERVRAAVEAAGGLSTKTREVFRARWPEKGSSR